MAEANREASREVSRPRGQSTALTRRDTRVDGATAILADIDQTRARMSQTLDQLGERLNPHVIKQQVKQGVHDATIGRVEHMARNAADRLEETRHSMMDTIRENPLPAALAGIGLGWLFINGRRNREHRDEISGYRYDTARDARGQPLEQGLYAGSSTYGVERGTAGDQFAAGTTGYDVDQRADEPGRTERMKERASHAADTARERAGHVAESARERTSQAMGAVRERSSRLADTARERTRQGARRLEDTFFENPLATAVATLALGVAAGLAIPETERERRVLGDTRDRVMDRVKDVADDAKERAQYVAKQTMRSATDTARETAREEGLTG